ncbi:hypothetical protein RAS1_06200 [Phycisphaerae bacterium RAS1]|nr:hypothetical protein RAS1_06200 [Phycisphaerae bacterium RAS1]
MRSWITRLLAPALICGLAFIALADDKKADKPAAKPGDPPKPAAKGDDKAAKPDEKAAGGMTQEMMDEFAKAGEPGENHKLLEAFVGNWKMEVKSMMGPGEPDVTSGTSTVKPIMGGRYFVDEVKGSMMGAPFEGMGVTGYDNLQKKFVNTWIDSASTGIFMSIGDYDAKSKEFTYRGDLVMPGGQKMKIRMVIRIVDKDKHVFEWHQTEPEGEKKTMEIVYTRAAG